MAKTKKSSSAKRSAPAAKRAKTTAKKSPARKPAAKPRNAKPAKAAPRKKIASVKPAKKKVAAPAKKPAKQVRTAIKKTVAKIKKTVTKKIVASKPRSAVGSKIATPKVIAKQSISNKISVPIAKVPAIDARPIKTATQLIQRNSIMSNTPKIIKKEVAPGGGIVQPATRTAPEMRLLADDAEILASATERYGRKDLEAFRKLITEQVQEAREEFEILSQNILDTSGEFEADNQTYSLHTAEQGTDAIEREKTFLHAQRTSDYIKKLDEAIERIDRGTYGICLVCVVLIAKERLQAVPITQKHVDCKNRTQARRPGPGNSGFRDEEPPPHVE